MLIENPEFKEALRLFWLATASKTSKQDSVLYLYRANLKIKSIIDSMSEEDFTDGFFDE